MTTTNPITRITNIKFSEPKKQDPRIVANVDIVINYMIVISGIAICRSFQPHGQFYFKYPDNFAIVGVKRKALIEKWILKFLHAEKPTIEATESISRKEIAKLAVKSITEQFHRDFPD